MSYRDGVVSTGRDTTSKPMALEPIYSIKMLITRKMVPITGRASSFLEYFFVFMYVNRKEEEGETEQLQSYQFTHCYITLNRRQVHNLTLNFIIHNQYNQHSIYVHTYIYIMNCSIITPSIKMIQLI